MSPGGSSKGGQPWRIRSSGSTGLARTGPRGNRSSRHRGSRLNRCISIHACCFARASVTDSSPTSPATPRILVVTYDFPPLATIGTQRPLPLLSYLDTLDWRLQVLTARPSAYRRGSPIEHPESGRWPVRTRVVRTTVVRGWSTIGGQLESMKLFVRSWIRHAAGTASDGPGLGAADATPRQSLKRTLEELCAMPDKEVGWLLPAVIGGLRALRGARPD